jgi:hypothetical protein
MTSVVSSTHYCYVAPFRLLFYDLCGGCDVASVGHRFPTFRTNIVPSYSRTQVSFVYSVNMKAKTALSLETSDTNYPLLLRHTPEERDFLTHRWENHRTRLWHACCSEKRDKDGRRGFRFVRLEALHGQPQGTKCVILWTQVAWVLMTGCRCSDGVCDPSFAAQGIVRPCGDQQHATVVRYVRGVNDVLPASSTFLIRFR